MVQVELRESTSMSPDLSAANPVAASSGTNFTLPASSKMAAASARHRSTSKPLQLPLSSTLQKPSSPWLTPQASAPLSRTAWSVCAAAAAAVARADASASRRDAQATRRSRKLHRERARGGGTGKERRVRPAAEGNAGKLGFGKSVGMAPPLQFRTLAHDDLGPDRNPVVEIHAVPVHEPEAARRNRVPDRLRLIGAVDAVDRVAEVKGARPEWIAGAAGHEPG